MHLLLTIMCYMCYQVYFYVEKHLDSRGNRNACDWGLVFGA